MDIVTARETKEVAMGRKSSRILIAFVVIMLMAIAAYIKIWTIDYRISSQESLLLRQQFDLAHREAMDESAEWRQRFDMEVEKSQMCIKELDQENMDLLEQIEILKQELEAEKFNCSMRHI
ncbi:uncharacterized protein LOC113776538 isoform X5 [Coffea eugenioides]|uniref:uncharacterized protein LOC113776538 isoform X5 n=1 Tax=Coffea eugenioides TaxID=49369 RepID=UPI000F60BBEC|nr:uncharacterized protein LOC113776538 isoform X5 [Coffea eugenioides]